MASQTHTCMDGDLFNISRPHLITNFDKVALVMVSCPSFSGCLHEAGGTSAKPRLLIGEFSDVYKSVAPPLKGACFVSPQKALSPELFPFPASSGSVTRAYLRSLTTGHVENLM